MWLPIVGAVLLGGCGRAEIPKAEEKAEEAAQSSEITLTEEKAKLAGVETTAARMQPIQAELKVAGTVRSNAKGRALVTPPVSGKILSIYVNPGEVVRQGQSLVAIQSPDLAQAAAAISDAHRQFTASAGEVRKAQAELNLARARLRTATAQLTRQYALAKAGAFSQPSLQSALNELNEAQADLESAKQDESVHQVQLDRVERLFKKELVSRSDLEQARLALSQDHVRKRRAEGRLATATSGLRRERQISERGLLTAREVQAAEAEVRSAKLEVDRAQIALDSSRSSAVGAQRAVSSAQSTYAALRGAGNGGGGSTVTLTAPISGTVTERKATVGQAVERSSELFEIEDLTTVWVTANVPEKQVASIALEQHVRIAAAAYPGRIFAGIVQVLGNHLEAKTRTMPVQCLVQNHAGLLREDMFATVVFGIGRTTNALVVPDSAVVRRTDEVSVFVRAGEKYEKRNVQPGRSAHGFTEITAGLKPGEMVVTKGLFIVESESRKGELKGEE
jgi:cobalt-zinc-cadmium efflux system membrane fusion protein